MWLYSFLSRALLNQSVRFFILKIPFAYSKISSLVAIFPETIFCIIILWSSSETCSLEINGKYSAGCCCSLPSCSQLSLARSSNLARFSGSRTSILAIRLKPQIQKMLAFLTNTRQRFNSLATAFGHIRRHGIFTVHDHGKCLTIICLLERCVTAHQHIKNNT